MRALPVVLLLSAVGVAAACSAANEPFGAGSGGESPAGTCAPTTEGVAAIFAQSCNDAGCHAAAEPAVGLDLASGDLEARLVEVAAASCDRTLVVPSAPDASFLYDKLVATSPACGEPMPVGAPLSAEELACVRDWIAAMAPGCETCGGSGCADLEGDVANCGACGNTCPAGATCEAQSCVCPDAQTACGDACTDTQSDPANCGDCGTGCPPVMVCSLGDCKMGCDAGLTQCGNACVDTQADPANCGDCGESCGTGTCEAGVCSCGPGIDPQTDPNNCGTCGNVCPTGQTCQAGQCQCGTASVSFANDVQPILTSTCANIGCHRFPMPKEGLNLSSGVAHGALVNVTASQCSDGRLLVAPGDPANSYLLDKILNVDICSGSKMPKMGTVPSADIVTLTNWICDGAQNN